MTVSGYSQTYRLNAYTPLSHADWKNRLYRFSAFQEGSIVFNRGVSSSRSWLMNYNMYLKVMEMITDRRDTIAVDPSLAILAVKIKNRLFINNNNKGFIELLVEGPVSLGVKYNIEVTMETSRGDRFVGTDMGPAMTSRYERLFTKKESYYFLDQESKVHPANKHWILKLFPERNEELRNYMARNGINFRIEQDLESLLQFCNALQ
jgi:hypothetical protein